MRKIVKKYAYPFVSFIAHYTNIALIVFEAGFTFQNWQIAKYLSTDIAHSVSKVDHVFPKPMTSLMMYCKMTMKEDHYFGYRMLLVSILYVLPVLIMTFTFYKHACINNHIILEYESSSN
jgi:uncharacterized membrane protein